MSKTHSLIPKILRHLSFKKEDGSEKRITLKHIGFLAYLLETESYKSMQTMKKELGMCQVDIESIIEDLCLPTVELGVPLVVSSGFKDSWNNDGIILEVFPYQGKMGALFEELYNKEYEK